MTEETGTERWRNVNVVQVRQGLEGLQQDFNSRIDKYKDMLDAIERRRSEVTPEEEARFAKADRHRILVWVLRLIKRDKRPNDYSGRFDDVTVSLEDYEKYIETVGYGFIERELKGTTSRKYTVREIDQLMRDYFQQGGSGTL